MVAFDEADAGEEKGDDGEADDIDGYDGDESGLKGLAVDGDGEDFEAEKDEEDGVLDLVDDLPEVVDAFVSDAGGRVILVEAAKSDGRGDGFKRGGEVPEVGQGVTA